MRFVGVKVALSCMWHCHSIFTSDLVAFEVTCDCYDDLISFQCFFFHRVFIGSSSGPDVLFVLLFLKVQTYVTITLIFIFAPKVTVVSSVLILLRKSKFNLFRYTCPSLVTNSIDESFIPVVH